jgi:hypothetical protein
MRPTALILAAALLAGAPAAAAQPRDMLPQQSISLHATAGDGSADGVADLTVRRDRDGWRLTGYVEAVKGCVELKAVNKHLGDYVGGDSITKTCIPGHQATVDAFTHHTDVVLTAIVPHGLDFDSAIVTLTGRP